MTGAVAAAAPDGVVLEHAAALWGLLKKRAQKRKTLTYAEAAEALGIEHGQALGVAWPLHVWCWMRGLPPINVVLVPRGKTAAPEGGFKATDYDVFHEALGRTVYTLEDAWFYPWDKVPDPTPEQLAWALHMHATHWQDLRDVRFLDLELELRQRDEARGFKRPPPGTHATWKDAEGALARLLAELELAGLRPADLRPPGKGPYPPPRPVVGNWAD
jgi:hypothetical protein